MYDSVHVTLRHTNKATREKAMCILQDAIVIADFIILHIIITVFSF